MAVAPFSKVGFGAREEVLTGDLVRAQQLISRDVQNVFRDSSRDGAGAPTAGLDRRLLVGWGTPATFESAVLANSGFKLSTGPAADESDYDVLRWPDTTLTHVAPDPANPRIDLIVATPGTVSSDIQTRNIMTDPLLRTVTPGPVAKTIDPTSTLSIVAGVAGVSPARPAVPVGAVALAEVFIPAAAVASTSFFYAPNLFRRVNYPFSTISCIVEGCVPVWSPLNGIEGAAGITISIPAASGTNFHAAIIDGELIEFRGPIQSVVDSSADPFAAPAPGGNHLPYYLYLCGRRERQFTANVSSFGGDPVCLVESLTPPDPVTGKPSGAINTPRGFTTGAVYVGVGWVYQGTTNRSKVVHVGDWATSPETQVLDTQQLAGSGVGIATGSVTFPSAPAVSNQVELLASAQGDTSIAPTSGAVISINLGIYGAGPGTPYGATWVRFGNVGVVAFNTVVRVPMKAGAGPHLNLTYLWNAATTAKLFPRAYNMRVRRLATL